MTSPDPDADDRDPTELTFEQAADELETLIEQIEDGSLGLEEALVARRRGEALIKRARAILDAAEKELETVTEEGEA